MTVLEKINMKLNIILKTTIATLVAAMTSIVILNVFSRYFFQISLSWSAELARYMMVWAAFLGMAFLACENKHLSMDLLHKALSKKANKVLNTIIQGISIIFYLFISVYGFVLVAQSSGQSASSIEFLPMSFVYIVIPFSGLLMLLGAARHVLIKRNNGDS